VEERERARQQKPPAIMAAQAAGPLRRAWLRVRHGRPGWLALRVGVAAVVPLVAQAAAPGDPAVLALTVGAVTWLVLTARLDLASRAAVIADAWGWESALYGADMTTRLGPSCLGVTWWGGMLRRARLGARISGLDR
jgi:hypothetical protein